MTLNKKSVCETENFKTISFLWEISQISESFNDKFLTYSLRTDCFNYFDNEKTITVPKVFQPKKACVNCFTLWSRGNFTLRIRRQRLSRIFKKLLDTQPKKLSRSQKNIMKLKKKFTNNVSVMKCLNCKRNTYIPFTMPENKIKYVINEVDNSKKMKRKKNKSKDLFAGLNSSVVIENLSNKSKLMKMDDKVSSKKNKLMFTINQLNVDNKESLIVRKTQILNDPVNISNKPCSKKKSKNNSGALKKKLKKKNSIFSEFFKNVK